MKQGKLLVFTGPSAVGKATVEKYLFKNPALKLGFSVSATTRQPREDEINGKHYFFLSQAEFADKLTNGEFVEWNEHFNNKYGTLKTEIKRLIDNDKIAFLELEPYGAMNIIGNYNEEGIELITIFLTPPSLESLEERIRKRGTETEEEIKTRLARAEEEISYSSKFQHIVINDDPERAAAEIEKIILERI